MNVLLNLRNFTFSLFTFACIILPASVKAQSSFGMHSDYTNARFAALKDTSKKDTVRPPMQPPKRAAIMSACLPGLGQAYNHYKLGVRYSMIKIPIIYAGFGALGYGFFWNQRFVKDYRDALRTRYDGDSTTIDLFPRYSDNDLVTLKNYYQRYRDICIIGFAAVYTLQIIDAAVDAHLSTFSVSDDLSLNIRPSFYPTANGVAGGVGIRLFYR